MSECAKCGRRAPQARFPLDLPVCEICVSLVEARAKADPDKDALLVDAISLAIDGWDRAGKYFSDRWCRDRLAALARALGRQWFATRGHALPTLTWWDDLVGDWEAK